MKASSGSRLIRLAAAAVVVASFVGCTDTVYKDFPGFTPPPTPAGSYMGYTSSTGQLPVCGNCHASHQALWATAKHSKAWADLQASGHAGPTCYACHSVNSLGNDTMATPANGYIGSATERYQDVQCEACHGPGENHVNNPEVVANRPIPSAYVAVGVNTSCSGCHTGEHNPFVEEWSQSAHGIVPDFSAGAGNASCQPCHTGQMALKITMGVTTNYKEVNNPLTTQGPNGALTIVCVVCHDPHGSPNKAQTRFPSDTNDVATNLCARCHNRNAAPTSSTTTRGPHAPEGPLLIGGNNVGWRPPNMTVDFIYGSHGDTTVNKGMCATCHMFKSTSTDSSGITFFSTGHLFLAVPCTDLSGKPTTDTTCVQTQRNFTTCATGSCHASGTVAMNLMNTEQLTLTNLLRQLGTLLNDTVKIPCSQYASASGSPWTTARGARFNYLLVAGSAAGTGPVCKVGSSSNLALPAPNAKMGAGVHNAPLTEQLLLNSIAQVQHDYP